MGEINIDLNKFINLEYVYRNIVLNNISSENFVLIIINILKNIENLNISQNFNDGSFITQDEDGNIIFDIQEVNFASLNINELLNDLVKLIHINKINHNVILNFDKCKFNETVVQFVNDNGIIDENEAIINQNGVQISLTNVVFYKASLEEYGLDDFKKMRYVDLRDKNMEDYSIFRECSFNNEVVKYIFDITNDGALEQNIALILKNAKTKCINLRDNHIDDFPVEKICSGTKINEYLARQIITHYNSRNCLYNLSLEKEYLRDINLMDIDLTNVNINGARLSYEQIQQIIDGQITGRAKGDLSGLDLSHMKLSRFNLNNVNATNADFTGAILSTEQIQLIIDGKLAGRNKGDLSGLDLCSNRIDQFDFTGVNLTNIRLNIEQVKLIIDGNLAGRNKGDLSGLYLSGINFDNMVGIHNLDNINFSNAILDYITFTNINIKNANFTNANLQHTTFRHTYIYDSDFTNAYLGEAIAVYVNFNNCNFTRANIVNSTYQYVEFKGNNIFNKIGLTGSNLSYRNNIENIVFTSNNIMDILSNKILIKDNTNFNCLNLTNMNQKCCQKLISISNEKGINFAFHNIKPSIELVQNMFDGKIPGRKKYDLSYLDFSYDFYFIRNERKLNEIFNSYVGLSFPFSLFFQDNFIDLTGSNLQNLDLNGLSSKKVKLNYADLTNSNLIECDLTQAELYGTKLNGAILYGTKFTLKQFEDLMDSGNFIEQQDIGFIKNFGISEVEKIDFAKYFVNKKINLFKLRNTSLIEIFSGIEDAVAKMNSFARLENILAEIDTVFNTTSKDMQYTK